MDIERLSKVQIVLLTLLVSFVTSIATGIVTVSLMDQAPPVVAQTVNRIIEHTVETVTPSGQTAAATVVTQEKTVIVKESELISQALQRVDPSIVRFYSSTDDTSVFLGLGVVLDTSGTIVGDTETFSDGTPGAVAQLQDGSRVQVSVTSRDANSGIAYLSAASTTIDGKPFVPAPISISTEHPVLGETVVMLGGKSVSRIASGIITALVPFGDSGSQIIETDIAPDSISPGSPLITTEGSLLGISTSAARSSSASGFVPGTVLMKAASPAGVP